MPEPFELEGADGGPLRGDLYPAGSAEAAVVLCHGFRGYKDWGFIPYLAERIAREGVTAVAFNFSGAGVTDREGRFGEPERFRKNTYAWELEDLRRVIDWLAARAGGVPAAPPPKIGLAGHSRGGAISVLTAARDPRVTCVATLAAPSRIMVWPDEYWRAWRRGESAAVYDFRTKTRLLLGPEVYEDMTRNGERYDVPHALERIETPLLVVQGDRDRQVPMEEAREIASRAPRASTELRVIEGAGHGFLAGDTLRRTPPQLLEMVEAVTTWMRRRLLA